MQKNSITNKITPCCGLPFSVMYWWVSNLTLNTPADRQYILSQISQNGTLSIDGWKALINSGTLEEDAALTKVEFLDWFNCKRKPSCEQLKLIIEGFKVGNWTPETELPPNIALIDAVINGQNINGNVYTKEQTDDKISDGFVSGIKGEAIPTTDPPETGFYRYIVHEAGTYTNFVDSGANPIVVNSADLDDNLVYLEVTDGVAKKILKPMNIADGSVTPEKTTFIRQGVFPIGKNILNPANKQLLKFLYPTTGQPFDASWAEMFWMIPIKKSTEYSFSNAYQVAWYDENQNLIGSVMSASAHITSPSDAKYLSVDYDKTVIPMVAEGHFYPLDYEPFVGIEGNKIENLFIELLIKDGNKIKIGDATTNEIFVSDIRNYFQNYAQGIFFGGGAGGETISNAPANTAWGKNALSSVTTGGANTAFGINALKSLTTGWDNTAFGAGALEMFEDGVGNQAMGRLALSKLVNGGHNTALTDSALEKLESGDNNTAVGYGSGTRIIEGQRNTLYGVYASGWLEGANATQITNYSDTVAFGAHTLNHNISGNKNTVVGNYGMYQLTGENNASLGYYTFYSATNASRNSALGNFAGQNIQNGNNNVFVGFEAGGKSGQKIDANGSTVIGAGAISTRDNEVVIGKATDTHATICGIEFTNAQLQALKNLV